MRWAELEGVVGYQVFDEANGLVDEWFAALLPSPLLLRAAEFRAKAMALRLEGSHLLEWVDGVHLLSISRRDGWVIHVFLHKADSTSAILALAS